ncbi:MAG: hypothetical protein IJ597_02470, partial [Synergistaceae bacterium]|nr:hypothetical protein [Synergistaceae bacterium]
RWRDKQLASDAQIFGLLMLGLFGLLLTWPEFWRGNFFANGKDFLPVFTAIFVALMMLLNIYKGHVAPGIIFCTLLASRYFFDHLFGYIPKAWGFSLLGIAMLILGIFFERVKKFLLKK